MQMDLKALKEEVISMLHGLSVRDYKNLALTHGTSYQFIIEEFGVVVCVLDVIDIVVVRNKVNELYKDWRIFYITTDDDLFYKKDELLYELMRCGYMKWIRLVYPRQFNQVVTLTDLGAKIMRKRLEIWNNKPKYKFLIEDNTDALNNSTSYVLSLDPGFFDYMPEIT